MELALLCVLTAVLAYLWRWDVGLGRACYVVGCKTGGVGGWVGGSGFQDAIIPSWRPLFNITTWVLIALTFVGTWYFLGWMQAVFLIVVFLVASVISKFALVPKPEARIYLRIIDRAVLKRAGELEREGDRALTAFAKGTSTKMHSLYPEKLASSQ